MTKPFCFMFFLLLVSLLHCIKTSAQVPAAAPSGPPNITAILEKGGQFTSFIRLLENTQQDDQINTQLNNSNQGLTVFAPTDNAFANLKSGTINSLSDQQKVQLVQFHILPTSMSTSQFQTASNPLRTQAGNSNDGEFPLNVTTSGNQVNLTTGVNEATVANTVFSGSNLAVYQVDQVLLPLDLFGSQAPAPAPSMPEKDVPVAATPKGSSTDASAKGYDIVLRVDIQGARTLRRILGDSAVFVFLAAESEMALVERLVERKTENREELLVRIATAREEVQHVKNFDYVVVNAEGKLDSAVKLVESVIDAEKAKVRQRSAVI